MTVHVPNLRDVGGVGVHDGAVVAAGRLLRSGLPAVGDLVPDTIAWPPHTVVDLRSHLEIGPEHPLARHAVEVRNVPLLSALRPGATLGNDLTELYDIVLANAPSLLVEVIQTVSGAEGATLVHCAAGKDRTGISIALTLRLLGADRDDIVDDYLLTARNAEAIRARLGQTPGRVSGGPLPPAFLETPAEAIISVLDTWDSHAGGARGWYLASGGSEADIERLRLRLVE